MDSSDIASWVALIVAVFAAIIALGQVIQQYASSGQLIRLCDSVVYGGSVGLPGEGRRRWMWTQLRFRVLYDVPVFRFPTSSGPIWATSPASARYWNSPTLPVEDTSVLSSNETYWATLSTEHQVGEASWVSFCRKIKEPCHDRVLITLKSEDADRCPPDLPNVPVPVHLREIIIMAFAIGLDCVEASLRARSLSMQGIAGGIASSNHPILGLLVHFTPLSSTLNPQPKYWSHWVARLVGQIPVGKEIFSLTGREGTIFWENSDTVLHRLKSLSESNPEISDISIFDVLDKSNWIQRMDGGDFGAQNTVGFWKAQATSIGLDSSAEWKPDMMHISSIKDLEIAVAESSIKWYWLSQMNIFEGHFATPWKSDLEYTVCVRAYNIIALALVSSESVGWDRVRFAGHKIVHCFSDGLPFVTYPPYAKGEVGIFRENSAYVNDTGWMNFNVFEAKLPAIILLHDDDFLSEQADTTHSDSVADNQLFVMELMRHDYWLTQAGNTHAIAKGKAHVLKNTPAIVQYALDAFYHVFRYQYISGMRNRGTSTAIRKALKSLGLSDAEVVFVLVAMLRTLRYGFCIGCGLNSKPAMDILTKDLSAHMV